MYEGGFDDFTVNSDIRGIRNNPEIERKKRMDMAYLLATNPESFDLMYKNHINLFHGTKGNALPSILKYGINSVDESEKKGIHVTTGEEWSRRTDENRSFVSFTDVLSIAENYASITPSKETQGAESFGVILGISSNNLNKLKTCTVDSYLPEIGIMDKVPIESIEMIAVPKSKVKFVSKLTEGSQIKVVPIDLEDKFYYIDDCGCIYFDHKEFEKFTQKRENEERIFNTDEVAQMAKGREKSGILKIFNKLKDKLKGVLKSFERE